MTDRLTQRQRSYCMSRVRGKDTRPELRLRKQLWAQGLRYRIGYKLPGKPDIVFVGPRVAVFVDGCFWHGCPKHATKPKNRADFWDAKLTRNKERDVEVNAELKNRGWTVLRFWEHEIKESLDQVVERVLEVIAARAA